MQEGDPEAWWHESFKGHSDSKPKGPEAISFDLTFVGAKHVYGLPERATSMALKPTVGRPPPLQSSTKPEVGLLHALAHSISGSLMPLRLLLVHLAGLHTSKGVARHLTRMCGDVDECSTSEPYMPVSACTTYMFLCTAA
jgi:hypothetical protein